MAEKRDFFGYETKITYTNPSSGISTYEFNEELFSKGTYKWVGGSTLGSYFVSTTSSHYDWAIKKLKAHQRNCKRK